MTQPPMDGSYPRNGLTPTLGSGKSTLEYSSGKMKTSIYHKNYERSWAVLAYSFNPSTWETEEHHKGLRMAHLCRRHLQMKKKTRMMSGLWLGGVLMFLESVFSKVLPVPRRVRTQSSTITSMQSSFPNLGNLQGQHIWSVMDKLHPGETTCDHGTSLAISYLQVPIRVPGPVSLCDGLQLVRQRNTSFQTQEFQNSAFT